jgi:hypothetical protein
MIEKIMFLSMEELLKVLEPEFGNISIREYKIILESISWFVKDQEKVFNGDYY